MSDFQSIPADQWFSDEEPQKPKESKKPEIPENKPPAKPPTRKTPFLSKTELEILKDAGNRLYRSLRNKSPKFVKQLLELLTDKFNFTLDEIKTFHEAQV